MYTYRFCFFFLKNRIWRPHNSTSNNPTTNPNRWSIPWIPIYPEMYTKLHKLTAKRWKLLKLGHYTDSGLHVFFSGFMVNQPFIFIVSFLGNSLIVCLIRKWQHEAVTHLECSCLCPMSFCKQLLFTPISSTLIKVSCQRCAVFSPSEQAKCLMENCGELELPWPPDTLSFWWETPSLFVKVGSQMPHFCTPH